MANDLITLYSTDETPLLKASPPIKPQEESLVFDGPDTGRTTGILGAWQVLLQTTIGCGCLMLPYSYRSGLAVGLGISLFFALLCLAAHYFLIRSANDSRCDSYHQLFSHAFSERYVIVLNVLMFLAQMGAVVIYSVWIGRLLCEAIGARGLILGQSAFWTMLVATFLMFPLMCLRSLAYLDWFASIATCFVGVLIAHAIYAFVKNGESSQVKWTNFSHWRVIITGAASLSPAYFCHVNDLSALRALERPTVKRSMIVCTMVVISAFILYNSFALITYLDLGELLTQDAALFSYVGSQRGVFWRITTCGVNVFLLISVPLTAWSGRIAILTILFKETEPSRFSHRQWVICGALIVFGASFLAAATNMILQLFDIVGGIIVPMVLYLLPACFYLRLVKRQPLFLRVVARGMIVLSFAVAGVCGFHAVYEWVHPGD